MKLFSKHRYFHSILFFWALLLIFTREPLFFLEPRFWAEEGTEFFQFAYNNSFFEMVSTPLVGYYTLFNICVSQLALLVPLEYAPLVTTYLSLIVQMVPALIIIYTDFKLWDKSFKKVILIFILTLITPLEIWMNTTNSHIIFGLIVFLISLSVNEKLSKIQKYFYRILIVIGTLTGPASSFSVPVFWLRCYRERTKEIIKQTVLITVCACIQVGIVIYSALFHNKYNRFSNFDFFKLVDSYFRDSFGLLLPFENDTMILLRILIVVYFIFLFLINRRKLEYQYLGIAFLIISSLSLLGSLGMKGSPRYSFIPSFILYLILVDEFSTQRLKINIRNIIVSIFLISTVTLSMHIDIKEEIKFRSPFYPKWKQEVKLFKENPDYKPRIFPYSDRWKWHLELERKEKEKKE